MARRPPTRRPIGVFRSAAHDSEEARNGKELHRTPARGDRGQRVADISAAAKHRIVDHILGLMAAMVKRRSERGSYPAAAALNEGPGPMARSGSRSQKLRWARSWSRTVF